MARIPRHHRRQAHRSLRCAPAIVAASVLAVGLAATGCAISVDERPQALEQDGWEEVLAGTSPTGSTLPADAPEDETVTIRLFFIGLDNKPESVSRAFPPDPGVNDILAGLADGPTDEEQAAFADQLQTRIPTPLNPRFGERDADGETVSIVVDPEADFRNLVEQEPEQARLVATQIVCTVLNLNLEEDVSGLIIEDDQGPIPVLDANGTRLDGAARLDDYNGCITGAEERLAEAEAEADGAEDGEAGDGTTSGDDGGTGTTTGS